MDRRNFLKFAAAGTTAVALPSWARAANAAQGDRPNVLLLMSDDHAWQEVGYMTPGIVTPNLDQIATETGIQFTRYYAGAAACSPSRACILTGRQAMRTGVRGPGNFVNRRGVYRSEQTIAQLFKQAGYATGHFGKWHVGDGEGYEPEHRGYDTAAWKNNHYNDNPGFARGVEHSGDGSEATVACALPFIRDAVKNDKPFFATIWFGSPHYAYESSKQHRGKYPDSPSPAYLAEITGIDVAIGQLRDALKKLRVRDDTQLWFCGDNGPTKQKGVLLCGPAGPIKPLISGAKGSNAEGGIRVPGVLEWPGQIKANRKIDVPISGLDFYPTFAAMLGVDAAPAGPLDGQDVMPILLGKQEQRRRGLPFYVTNRYPGEPDHKGRPTEPYAALVEQRWKCRCDKGRWRLFDLQADPLEYKNMAGQNPEVMARMRAELEAFHQSLVKDVTRKEPG